MQFVWGFWLSAFPEHLTLEASQCVRVCVSERVRACMCVNSELPSTVKPINMIPSHISIVFLCSHYAPFSPRSIFNPLCFLSDGSSSCHHLIFLSDFCFPVISIFSHHCHFFLLCLMSHFSHSTVFFSSPWPPLLSII